MDTLVESACGKFRGVSPHNNNGSAFILRFSKGSDSSSGLEVDP